jgi:hypothetical protein
MLSLVDDSKAGLFQCSYGAKMVDARKFGHGSDRDFHFPHAVPLCDLVESFKVFTDCRLNVFNSFLFRLTLRPAARQARTRDAKSFLGFLQDNPVFHKTILPRQRP